VVAILVVIEVEDRVDVQVVLLLAMNGQGEEGEPIIVAVVGIPCPVGGIMP
jgi:hypothetical protein